MKKIFSKKGLVTFLLAVFACTVILPLGQEAKAVKITRDESADILEKLEEDFPNIKERCADNDKQVNRAGDNLDTDVVTGNYATGQHSVQGTVSFGKLGGTGAYAGLETDEVDKINVMLMSDYSFGGEGTLYCIDTLYTDGSFQFDVVYPGTYYLVIDQTIEEGDAEGFGDWVAGAACDIAGLLPGISAKGCKGAAGLNLKLSGTLTVDKAISATFDTRGDEPTDPAALPVIKVKESSLLSYIIPDVLGWAQFTVSKILNGATRVFLDSLLIMRGLDNEAVRAGWSKIRDISNFMLILALIIIALANVTRFNLEAYTAKSLIPRLVLAGIFINFSLLLTRFIVDIANVLTVYLSANTDFAHMWNFGEVVVLNGLLWLGGPFSAIFMIVFMFMAFFATIAILLVLIARFAVIWLCAIFSPIVFLFAVLPFTRSLTGMWWKYLIKFAFIGPVMALLMYVASYL